MSDEWKGIEREAGGWVDRNLPRGFDPSEQEADLETLIRRAVAHGYRCGLYEETQGQTPLGTAVRFLDAIEEGHVDPMNTHGEDWGVDDDDE